MTRSAEKGNANIHVVVNSCGWVNGSGAIDAGASATPKRGLVAYTLAE
jgi:hypothetical protein